MVNRKIFIFTGVLIVALVSLLAMLFHWGRMSIDTREALFADQVKINVDDLVERMEDNYFCFDLRSEMTVPKLDSFFVPNLANLNSQELMDLRFHDPENGEKHFDKFPVIAPAAMQMLLRFDFLDVPEFKPDSELTSFERFVRDTYDRYLLDENGRRLIDTTQFDSLLLAGITPLFADAKIAYQVSNTETNEVIYTKNLNEHLSSVADVSSLIFSTDPVLPEILLELNVVNKSEMFVTEKWTIYTSAILLGVVCIIFIVYLVRIQLQQKKLLQLQRDFIHGMTHEFNTPITSIKLVAKRLFKSGNDDLIKTAEILNEESGKLETGINLVLTTALLEKEELLLQTEDIDISELLERTIEKNKTRLEASGIKVDLDLTKEHFTSQGDPFHIENVLQNLINNVEKHSGANALNIKTHRVNGHVNIVFTDNGKGIREEERDKIFGKFERTGNSNRKNGYGLGLYYSKMILKMHGGNIEYVTNGSTGSTFKIELPV